MHKSMAKSNKNGFVIIEIHLVAICFVPLAA